MGCNAFCIDHGFIRRHIQMQVLLVDATEATEICPEGRAPSFTIVAVDFTAAIPIVIPGPFAGPVAHGGVGGVAAMIALPLVGKELHAVGRNVVGNQLVAGPRVCVITHPKPLLPRLPRDHADDRGAIVGVGAVSFALIAAPPWRVGGIAMGRAFFPRRSGTVHRPRRRYQPSPPSAPSRSHWLECVAVRYGAVSVTGPTRAPGVRLARPWQSRAATGLGSPVVVGFSQRPCPSGGCSTHRSPGNDMPENGPGYGTAAAPCSRSEGISGRPGAGAAPAKSCRCCRPASR
jgi:hypothetical protein